MSFATLLINDCVIERYSQASIVIGDIDGLDYYCIEAHVSAPAVRPTSGANWANVWKATGGSGEGEVWTDATLYALSLDTYGNPNKDWANLPSQKGRISYPKGRQIQRGTEVTPVDAVLFLNDVAVTERDKVLVDTIEFEILFVATLQDGATSHHKELSLARVKA